MNHEEWLQKYCMRCEANMHLWCHVFHRPVEGCGLVNNCFGWNVIMADEPAPPDAGWHKGSERPPRGHSVIASWDSAAQDIVYMDADGAWRRRRNSDEKVPAPDCWFRIPWESRPRP